MRQFLIACALLFGAVAQPAAAQPTRVEMAQELVRLLDIEAAFVDMFEVLTPIMSAAISQEMGLSSSDAERLTGLFNDEMRAGMPELMASMADVYASELSEQQLIEITAFLRSPAGRALVSSQSAAQARLEGLGEQFGIRVAERAVARFVQARSQPPT